MADEKLNTGPEVQKTEEASAPAVADPAHGEAAVPEHPPEQAGPADPGNVVISAEQIDALMAEKRQAARAEVEKAEASREQEAGAPVPERPAAESEKAEKPRRGRPPKSDKTERTGPEAEKEPKKAGPRKGRPSKADKAAPDKAKPQPRDKMSQSKPPAGKGDPVKAEAPATTEQPPAPRDATRSVKEEIVYLNLSELHPFKNHPFSVRDDAEMQGLVESVKAAGVNQPALVRPREGGGYEIIAGHRRQRASELAGFANMPCIVRNMTDDEAILAMTDDNLRHREKIVPTERGAALKQQVEAIKHQGARPGEADKDAGKRSTQIVGDRNGMNYKQVQRYIRLTELVPELRDMVDASKLAFTPAVEISFIRPKYQKYIAVAIEGQVSSPSLSQAQKMRELDKEGKLNGDVIDGILSEPKKEVDKVIINSAELEKYFGKDKTPREMKDTILALLDEWKEKQPPELGKPEKKADKAL